MSKNYGQYLILIDFELNKVLYKQQNDNLSYLSIVIPTYNRIDNLKLLLTHISSENKLDFVEIIILDNYSNSILPDQFFVDLFKDKKISYYQNKFHLGPDANYLKAIELANCEWVYPIGDSKIPKKGFVDMILNDIKLHKDSFGIVYKYASNLKNDLTFSNIKYFNDKKIHLGDFFLGGNSIISRKSIILYLNIAGQVTLSRMPHATFHLMPVLNFQSITLKKDAIIELFLEKPSNYNPKLSFFECLSQFSLIDVITNDWAARKIINKKIFEIYGENWRFIYHSLNFTFKKKIDISSNIHRILKFRFIHGYGYINLIVALLLYYFIKFLKLIRYVK